MPPAERFRFEIYMERKRMRTLHCVAFTRMNDKNPIASRAETANSQLTVKQYQLTVKRHKK